MNARYIAIYKLRGVNSLPEGAESARFIDLPEPTLGVVLTTNPEPHFQHIDKCTAIANLLLNFFSRVPQENTHEERLASESESVRVSRAKRTGAGVFLVVDAETKIPTPEFKARRDTEEYGICLDDIGAQEIRETFRPSIRSVMIALALSLPPNAHRGFEMVGDVIYLVDPTNGKPVYTFRFGLSARATVASPLTSTVIANAAALMRQLIADGTIARPTSLLFTSLEEPTDELQGFIAAWSSLEIFVNATFKSAYEARWRKIMEDGAPRSENVVVGRPRDATNDSYSLATKFSVIADVLDPTASTADAEEFKRLKKVRDRFFHAFNTPPASLPIDAIQKLVLKYIRLHLNSCQDNTW